MKPEQLFDLIETTIQGEVDKAENLNVYLEREMRGTHPTMIVRVLLSPREKKTKAGAKVLASQKPVQSVPEPSPAPEPVQS
jgi:hypothetical protein